MSSFNEPLEEHTAFVQATICRQSLVANLAKIRQHSGLSPIWGVVKANAYGHGLAQVVPIIVDLVQGLACARLHEAQAIIHILKTLAANNRAQKMRPVLILGGCYEIAEISTAQRLGCEIVVHCLHQLELIEKAHRQVLQQYPPLTIWLKVNVGMNRLGISAEQLPLILERFATLAFVHVKGVMTHLGTADEPTHPQTLMQMKSCVAVFAKAQRSMPALLTSLSNSAHLFGWPDAQGYDYPWHGQIQDWVRPGISLYGASPYQQQDAKSLGLKPVMTLAARVLSIRDIQPEQCVGYGATWVAEKPCRLFVLGIGYGDGYPRHIEKAQAFFNGVMLDQAGRVSMDYTVFRGDVNSENQHKLPRVGDMVELWGDHIAVDDVASRSQTIGYERLTQLSSRVHRRVSSSVSDPRSTIMSASHDGIAD